VNWRIIGFSSYGPDCERLSPEDRLEFDDELFRWVEDGPPCHVSRMVSGVEVYDDVTAAGLVITYVVGADDRYVGVLRVRRRPAGTG